MSTNSRVKVVVAIAKDRMAQSLISHVVPCKGADQKGFFAKAFHDLERLGQWSYCSSQWGEPPLVVLVNEVAKGRANRRTVFEQTALKRLAEDWCHRGRGGDDALDLIGRGTLLDSSSCGFMTDGTR